MTEEEKHLEVFGCTKEVRKVMEEAATSGRNPLIARDRFLSGQDVALVHALKWIGDGPDPFSENTRGAGYEYHLEDLDLAP